MDEAVSGWKPAEKSVDSMLSWYGWYFRVCIKFCAVQHGDSVNKPDLLLLLLTHHWNERIQLYKNNISYWILKFSGLHVEVFQDLIQVLACAVKLQQPRDITIKETKFPEPGKTKRLKLTEHQPWGE